MSFFNLNHIKNYIGDKEKIIIFDIGAHDFSDSINLKRNVPNSIVYGIEAYDYNVKKYGDYAKSCGVNVINCAISDKDGETFYYNSIDFNGREWTCSGSILKPTEEAGVVIHPGLNYNREGVKIQTNRLDTFCRDNNIESIDVIHMDIQGAEYYGLKGLGELRPKIIFCETCEYDSFENSLSRDDLDNLLSDMGYIIKERLEYDTLYILNT
jgi:FkbM family methyltransferase